MNYNVKKYKGDLGINTNTFKVNVTNYQNAPKEMLVSIDKFISSQRGVDYWTAQDLEYIILQILLNIPDFNETDPTVPSWAKQPTKPSYNYNEINNTPDLSGYITTSALNTALGDYATTQDLEDAIENTPYYSYVEDEGGVLGSDSVRPLSYIKTESGDVYAIGELNSTGYEDWSLVTKTYVDNAIGDLATVATSGSYNDLTNKPAIPDGMELLIFIIKFKNRQKRLWTNQI